MPTFTRGSYAISLAASPSSSIAAAPLSSPRPKRRRASSSDAPAAASQNYSMQGDRASLTVANHAAVFREDARNAAKQASMDKADAARAMEKETFLNEGISGHLTPDEKQSFVMQMRAMGGHLTPKEIVAKARDAREYFQGYSKNHCYFC